MPLIHAVQLFGDVVQQIAISEKSLRDRLIEAREEIIHVNNDGNGPLIPGALLGQIMYLQSGLTAAKDNEPGDERARELILTILL